MKTMSFGIGVCAVSVLACACAASDPAGSAPRRNEPGGTAGAAGMTGVAALPSSSGASAGGAPPSVAVRTCDSACTDFPEQPIFEAGVPSNAPALFAAPASGVGPCVYEPADGALLPMNWLRPRFRYEAANGANLFQITLHAARELHDLVVYTTSTSFTLPKEIWSGLTANAFGDTVQVTVRAAVSGSALPAAESKTSFTIAPVTAGGSLVYWAIDKQAQSLLVGFRVGDEGTVTALTPAEVGEYPMLNESGQPRSGPDATSTGHVQCVGCHTSTPDGKAVAFTDTWPWNTAVANIEQSSAGTRPDYVSAAGARLLQQPWLGAPTFSKALWESGQRLLVTSFGNPDGIGWSGAVFNNSGRDRLAWFDLSAQAELPESGAELSAAIAPLEGSAFGFIARNGDTRGAVNPTFSNDGSRIIYASAERTSDGHVGGEPGQMTEVDLYSVPFAAGAGGDATPISGAAEPGVGEYYPDLSADDALLAFNRTTTTEGKFYYRPDGEIYVMPSSGGQPVRLSANDPPACSGEKSPGVINSWAKWSPLVQEAAGKKYYFLIFSSARKFPEQFSLPSGPYSPPDTRASQLYMAAVVVENGAIVSTHPGVYLWNQTTETANLTPAWDDFQIPPVVVK